MWQINKTVTEHKKLVETSGRLQRMVPDKDAFLENLNKARQAAHEVRNTSCTMYREKVADDEGCVNTDV